MEWTKDRDQLLTELWDRGYTGSEIAERLKTTRSAVLGRARRINLSFRISAESRASTVKRTRPITPFNSSAVSQVKKRTARLDRDDRPIRPALFIPRHERVSLDDLAPHHCRWPFTEDGEPTTYCGRKRELGLSYCTQHALVAFTASRAHEAIKASPAYEHSTPNARELEAVE